MSEAHQNQDSSVQGHHPHIDAMWIENLNIVSMTDEGVCRCLRRVMGPFLWLDRAKLAKFKESTASRLNISVGSFHISTQT